jgi:hypothetical protein
MPLARRYTVGKTTKKVGKAAFCGLALKNYSFKRFF